MNKTELAIIEQIAQLDEGQQARILKLVQQIANEPTHTSHLGEWLESARRLRSELRTTYGENHYFNTQAILDEIRDEEAE